MKMVQWDLRKEKETDSSQRQSVDPQMLQSINCELCGGSHNSRDCPHESQFSQLGKDSYVPNLGSNLHGRRIKQPIQRGQLKKQPFLWNPNYPLKKKQVVAKQQPQRNRLTTENVSEFSQE